MIATLDNTVSATSSVIDTLGSLFAELDLHLAGAAATAETDLVINELDQWRNPQDSCLAPSLTWGPNLIVQEMTQR